MQNEEFAGVIGDFNGTYDGNGYTISNVNIKGRGLFETNRGTLTRINVAGGEVYATGEGSGVICGANAGGGEDSILLHKCSYHNRQ
ncbi:MAG: hypothetical protein LUE99_13600 [Bacteroides sp.]|nr:hypothetical protein [Bacteroides sp.]